MRHPVTATDAKSGKRRFGQSLRSRAGTDAHQPPHEAVSGEASLSICERAGFHGTTVRPEVRFITSKASAA